MSTGLSTYTFIGDKGCGKPVDNVDNIGGNRDIPPFSPFVFVDNPVETVDEYVLWLCIKPEYEHA
jgi:hypothetical protein